jgi:hypothetical protein
MTKTSSTHSAASAIEVSELRKSYGEVAAVRGISFEVAQGEVFCLLGPNGAGKTTTVEMLEGYRKRTGGEVRVLGMDPADGEREFRERVSSVLQQTGVQTDLTVMRAGEIIAVGAPDEIGGRDLRPRGDPLRAPGRLVARRRARASGVRAPDGGGPRTEQAGVMRVAIALRCVSRWNARDPCPDRRGPGDGCAVRRRACSVWSPTSR